MSLLPRTAAGTGGQSSEQLIKEKIRDLLKELPELFDTDDVSRRYKINREQSMNTVLIQEIIRFAIASKWIYNLLSIALKILSHFFIKKLFSDSTDS